MRLRAFFFCLSLLFITGCTEAQLASHIYKKIPDSSSEGNFKVGSPYKVMGQWFRPQEDYNYSETGIASWYGPDFHGKRTANGEIFDMNELTAAHKTLQLPSLVRVTNLENGRSVVLRVNDRGPFKRGRIIDVSKRAAELLGFKGKGTAKVRVQVLTEESKKIAEVAKRGQSTKGYEVAINNRRRKPVAARPAPLTPAPGDRGYQTAAATTKPVERLELPEPKIKGHNTQDGRFYPDPVVQKAPVMPTNIFVQAGSFTDQDNAARLAGKLRSFGPAHVYPAIVNGRQFYRVRIAAANVDQADHILARMASAGNGDAIIVVE